MCTRWVYYFPHEHSSKRIAVRYLTWVELLLLLSAHIIIIIIILLLLIIIIIIIVIIIIIIIRRPLARREG